MTIIFEAGTSSVRSKNAEHAPATFYFYDYCYNKGNL